MKKSVTVAAFAMLFMAGSAFAQNGYIAKPGTYDPDNTGIVTAAWSNSIGLPDKGGSNFGLLLQKNGLTSANAASGAFIQGVEGITLTVLGFDYKDGSHCGGGAPRFNVLATDGFHFIGGCGNATPVGAPAVGWTRVTLDPYNPAQAFPVLTPGATILSITLILDEGTDQGTGSALLDNINVNGTYIGKPGVAK